VALVGCALLVSWRLARPKAIALAPHSEAEAASRAGPAE
jgi:hypothetical protein